MRSIQEDTSRYARERREEIEQLRTELTAMTERAEKAEDEAAVKKNVLMIMQTQAEEHTAEVMRVRDIGLGYAKERDTLAAQVKELREAQSKNAKSCRGVGCVTETQTGTVLLEQGLAAATPPRKQPKPPATRRPPMTDHLQRIAACVPVLVEAGCNDLCVPMEFLIGAIKEPESFTEEQEIKIITAVLKEWFAETVVPWTDCEEGVPAGSPFWVEGEWEWYVDGRINQHPDPTEAFVQCLEALTEVVKAESWGGCDARK